MPPSARALENTGSGRIIPELDGVRGVAILLVLLFHLKRHLAVYFLVPRIFVPLEIGWSGVDLFFVLSGFLITSILLRTKGTPNYFGSFYGRRVLRIFPLYYAALFFFFFIELPWQQHAGRWLDISPAEQSWYWSYLANWRNISVTINPLSHLWSLSIEEQFYAFWPFAIFLCDNRYLKHLCVAIIGASFGTSVGIELVTHRSDVAFLATISRLDTLALGALLAVVMWEGTRVAALASILRRALPAAVIATIVCVMYQEQMGVRSLLLLSLAVVYSWIVFQCATGASRGGPLATTMRNPALRSMGRYSYAMYVLHPLVLRYAIPWTALVVKRLPTTAAIVVAMTVSVAIIYGVARLSWFVLEERFLRWKDLFPYSRSPLRAARATAS